MQKIVQYPRFETVIVEIQEMNESLLNESENHSTQVLEKPESLQTATSSELFPSEVSFPEMALKKRNIMINQSILLH